MFGQPFVLDADVVVSPTEIVIYTNDTDGTSGAGSELDVLPPLETCVDDDDEVDGNTSCLSDFTVLDNGVQIALGTPDGPDKHLEVAVGSLNAPVLHLDGCGGEASIPLAVPPPAAPSLAVATDSDSITAMWGGPIAVQLTFSGGTFAHRCRTQTSPYTYTVPPAYPPPSAYPLVSAQALDGPTTIDTELGTIRLWSGAITLATP